jgi:hypothetical protein
MASEPARVAARLRAAFGPLYGTLISEAPEREAWTRLGLTQVEDAMARARERMGEPGHALGFRTLLKQELDAVCDLTPPAMSFEAPSLPPDRLAMKREARRDERARERERQAELRRDELRAQARLVLTDDDTRGR